MTINKYQIVTMGSLNFKRENEKTILNGRCTINLVKNSCYVLMWNCVSNGEVLPCKSPPFQDSLIISKGKIMKVKWQSFKF